MIAIKARTANRAILRLKGRIKLSRVLAMPENVFENRIRQIEADPLFKRLSDAGVISVQRLPHVQFVARLLQEFQLRASDDGIAELLDGDSYIARLIRRIGRERFEQHVLADEGSSDTERARLCDISLAEARSLREFMDRFYVRSEFQSLEDQILPVTVYSSVAGVGLENGRPVLGFFNREIWKGRYRTDETRYRELRATLTSQEAVEVEQFMSHVNLLAFRQTTLYRVLEMLIESQVGYLTSGDPAQRRPLTQREVAASLNVAPSVVSQLIANKSVELPWRLEVPLKTLLPSRKAMLRDKLYELAVERPDAGDDLLREELRRRYGATISRPSIIQYRKELGIGGAGHRGSGAAEAIAA